ncbi:BREX-1 system adenine-specific DNA-methyltransferase PglX [Fournierella massiliensis]|nr:BREX-1 system adenine-specific DNA-methyltransferase PglX [Fournierella massiliensis]MCF2556006.1 BREX-1 system adenine-specific DNA-methyltransferase PglX [Fournierella massiliensis]
MNKTAIKNFAVWARRKLIADITYRAGMLGITESGIAQPMQQSTKDLQFFDIGTKDYVEISGEEIKQRNALIAAIRKKEGSTNYKEAFQNVVEEVAYTWFNRLVAVRFMEVNDYLPSRIRVLSAENPNKLEPDFVTTPFDTDMEFTPYEKDRVLQLKEDNKLDELFRFLFIKQCNKLGEILPELFEQISDYTELLLNISFTDKDGIIYHLTHDISEDDFNVSKEGQVEIIGWMYQYYNTEPKDEVFALLKKNVKITKERIPAATQLFTPDWIVRYMVENSLGRLWVEGHPNEGLKSGWKYYLEEAKQEPEVVAQLEKIRAEYAELNPEDIKVIDPCMGSGHILVYAFDVLMQIYEAQGYTQRDAAKSILKYNLYGIDIDTRAYQLAYFAVMMKARQYNRRIFNEHIMPNLMAVKNTGTISKYALKRLGEHEKLAKRLMDDFTDAEEYGSILDIHYSAEALDALQEKIDSINEFEDIPDLLAQMECGECKSVITPLVRQARIMGQKYDAVITNPPYMGINSMGGEFYDYITTHHEAFKHDLYCVFIDVCHWLLKPNRYQAMITQQSFMFNARYEKARTAIIADNSCVNLLHLGARAFEEIGGEVVQTATYVFMSTHVNGLKGYYLDLQDYQSQESKEQAYTVLKDSLSEGVYKKSLDDFRDISGFNYSYWLSNQVIKALGNKKTIATIAETRHGLVTGSGEKFMRLWPEISQKKFNTSIDNASLDTVGTTWFPYNKGGTMRRWYGNREYVVNWENNGFLIRNYRNEKGKLKSSNYNNEFNCQPDISWTDISTGLFSARYTPQGALFDTSGPSLFLKSQEYSDYLLGLMNSKVMQKFLDVFCVGLHYSTGSVASIPLVVERKAEVEYLVQECLQIAVSEWDSYELSWDYQEHPLVALSKGLWDATAIGASMHYYYGGHPEVSCPLELCFMLWQGECNERFKRLKANEEELNRIFIDIYGLQDELTSEVEDKDVTVRKADLQRDIKSLISYAVGCMFGRYSLNVPGLAYAGGDWDSSKYSSFMPDEDNCIPITDEEYFQDDIVGRFVEFIRIIYGEDSLEANLDYIAKALGSKGKTSRDTIRQYFLNDFYKDHCQTYSVTGSGKRPIYWMFNSGKQNGFKALVYMHRWTPDTVGNVRVEYLHKMELVYEKEMETCQDIIDNSLNSREIAAATKRKEKLVKQLKECKDYDALMGHIAGSRIGINLDDGVKLNYRLVQTGKDGRFCEILADSKDIMIKENSEIWQNLVSSR